MIDDRDRQYHYDNEVAEAERLGLRPYTYCPVCRKKRLLVRSTAASAWACEDCAEDEAFSGSGSRVIRGIRSLGG